MAVHVRRQVSDASIVRVQVLTNGDGVRLVKRFAEAIRDSVRADALFPILPDTSNISDCGDSLVEVSLVRSSVNVPNSSVEKVKAYARMLRNAARSGVPLPKFSLASNRDDAKHSENNCNGGCSRIEKDSTDKAVDTARIRELMRNAREARNV